MIAVIYRLRVTKVLINFVFFSFNLNGLLFLFGKAVVGHFIASCTMHRRYVNILVVLFVCAIYSTLGADGYLSAQNAKVGQFHRLFRE